MITIQAKTPYFLEPQELTFYFSTIYIGPGKSCHIKIPGTSSHNILLKLMNQEEGILVEGVKSYPYLVNGKKIIGTKVIKINDIIEFEECSLKVLISNPSLSPASLNLESLYNEFYENHEELTEVLTALEQELVMTDDSILDS